ncbi:MAG: hypothetical protein RLZZ361_1217 [Cyanobacteriota bacterium]
MVINKELVALIKKMQIKTDRLASEILAGEYRSAFRGRGINFESVREYQIGDDIRFLDWKITAKMQEPYIRQYKEERQLSIVLIIDLSASTFFGTQKFNKKELAVELASVLASLAIKNNDKVGLMLVTDKIEAYIPPKQGKAQVFKLIRDLLSYTPSSPKTNLKAVLQEASRRIPPRSVVFLISDFINFDNEIDYIAPLKILRNTQDLIAVSIRDPREFSLPNIGFIEIVDPESERKTLLNLNKKSVRNKFLEKQKNQQDQTRAMFKSLGIDFLDLYTHKPYIKDLLELFIRREKRH